MTSVTVNAVPPSQTGVATGINTNIRNIGGAIGTAVFTGIIMSTTGASGYPTAGGYTIAFTMLAVLAAVSMLISIAVPRTFAPPTRSTAVSDAADGERTVTAPVNIWSAADEDWR